MHTIYLTAKKCCKQNQLGHAILSKGKQYLNNAWSSTYSSFCAAVSRNSTTIFYYYSYYNYYSWPSHHIELWQKQQKNLDFDHVKTAKDLLC